MLKTPSTVDVIKSDATPSFGAVKIRSFAISILQLLHREYRKMKTVETFDHQSRPAYHGRA